MPVCLLYKGSLGRFAIPMPEIVKNDPFWLNEDPHRTTHTLQALIAPTLMALVARLASPRTTRAGTDGLRDSPLERNGFELLARRVCELLVS